MDEYKNLYELFGLDENASQQEVKKVTKDSLRDSHPDRNESISPSQFETIKKGREILSDKKERDKYDTMGHNKYVNDNLEKPLTGYNFVGSSSLSSEESNEPVDNDEDSIEDLIEYSPNNSSMSGAVKQDGESVSATKGRDGDYDHAAQARKKREDVDTEKTDDKVVKSAGIFVTIGSVLTDDTVKLSILVVVLLSLYGVVYTIFGGLGVAFAFMFSIGLFYFPAFRKLLSFDD